MVLHAWDPERYSRFGQERAAPFHDLVALIEPATAPRVLDLGCGSGQLTALLVDRLGAADVLGIDNAPAMLRAAQGLTGSRLRFEYGDIAKLETDEHWDVILSNAALHWVPDHPKVLAQWTRRVAPGGQLAFQLPANGDHLSHRIAAEVALESPFVEAFAGDPPVDPSRHTLPVEIYSQVLDQLGYEAQHVRLQVYPHHLDASDDVVAWVEGTLLTPHRARLSDSLYAQFIERYRRLLLSRLGRQTPYLYTYKRIIAWGRTAAASGQSSGSSRGADAGAGPPRHVGGRTPRD